jgi:hypothetical protein
MTDRPGQLTDDDLLLLLRGGWWLPDGPEDFSEVASTLGRHNLEVSARQLSELEREMLDEPPEARGLP